MTTTEIIKKVIELQELEDMLHELNAEIDSIKDSLKQELNEQHSEELIVGTHVIRFILSAIKKISTLPPLRESWC